MIPKRIFQTYYSSCLIPELYDRVIKLQELNPDYEYEFYDDDACYSFLVEHFSPVVANAWTQILPGAYKADLWRYCVLYVHGGVYLDIKGDVLIGFDQMFSKLDRIADFMITDEVHPYVTQGYYWNGFMMSEPHHEFCYRAIKHTVINILNRDYCGNCLDITGTGVFRRFKGLFRPEHHPFAIHQQGHNIMIKKNREIVIGLRSPAYRVEQKQRNSIRMHYPYAWSQKKVYIDNNKFTGDVNSIQILKSNLVEQTK